MADGPHAGTALAERIPEGARADAQGGHDAAAGDDGPAHEATSRASPTRPTSPSGPMTSTATRRCLTVLQQVQRRHGRQRAGGRQRLSEERERLEHGPGTDGGGHRPCGLAPVRRGRQHHALWRQDREQGAPRGLERLREALRPGCTSQRARKASGGASPGRRQREQRCPFSRHRALLALPAQLRPCHRVQRRVGSTSQRQLAVARGHRMQAPPPARAPCRATREERRVRPLQALADGGVAEGVVVHQLEGEERIAGAQASRAELAQLEALLREARAEHRLQLLHRATRGPHSQEETRLFPGQRRRLLEEAPSGHTREPRATAHQLAQPWLHILRGGQRGYLCGEHASEGVAGRGRHLARRAVPVPGPASRRPRALTAEAATTATGLTRAPPRGWCSLHRRRTR